MINVTDKHIVISQGADLDRKIRISIEKFLFVLNEKHETTKNLKSLNGDSFRNGPEFACVNYFSKYKKSNIRYGCSFIQALIDVAEIGSRNQGISNAIKNLNIFLNNEKGLSASVGTRMKSFSRLLIFIMWCEKVIILPYNFHFGGSSFTAYLDIVLRFETEVAAFLRSYKTYIPNLEVGETLLPISGADSIYKYGPRLIWSTDYHTFEDVNLVEICKLHKAILGFKDKYFQGVATPPSALMLREMLQKFPFRMNYTAKSVESLVIWLNSLNAKEYDFEIFLINRVKILEDIKAKKLAAELSASRKRYLTPKKSIGQPKADTSRELLLLSLKDDHQSIVDYFCRMHGVKRNGVEWLRHGSPYSGREHIYLGSITGRWIETWTAWIKYRKTIQGFDDENSPFRAFNIFCDYLFLYLPWWKELFPDNQLELPLSPNQLKRSVFIHRTELDNNEPISITKLPLAFLDILAIRTPNTDSRYIVINQLIQFLDWVEVGFEDDDKIAGKAYRNPIKRIDLPRVKKKTKTNKITFSKRVYPHLLFFCYAVEAFGEYLQYVAMERPDIFSGKKLRQLRFFSTGPFPNQVNDSGIVSEEYLKYWPDNFGYTPFISYRGKNYPIHRIPDIYQWAVRQTDLERYNINGGNARRWLPHLAVLRMLTCAVETGLRLQSIQWLDLREWDSINKVSGIPINLNFNMSEFKSGKFALPLLISTDKSKNEPWSRLTVFRVRSSFHREQYFRESISEAGMDTEVDYENIKDSRFGKILPLFRSHNSPMPISDNVYMSYWVHLLWGFEEYFHENISEENEFIQFVYLKGTDKVKTPDYSQTVVTDLLAINTPHACRATYATNRNGTLEVSDITQQLGQRNTVVTMHYTLSTPEILAEKLALSELEIQAGFNAKISKPSYVRADDVNSALYKSFKSNRAETIKSFHFAPSIALWSTEDISSNNNGIEMLQNSPMSQICFRETHICPVGEACPADILVEIGEPLRCGICPLAMRCVDHLPAIAAKINQLKMNVRSNILRAEQFAKKKEPDSSVDTLYEAAEINANEMVGWQYSHDILLKMLETAPLSSERKYHIHSPDIVRRHLQLVTSDRTISEFFLQRIADANAFPTMADPQIQLVADRYCRFILSDKYFPSLEEDPITILAGLLKTHLEPYGLTINDLAKKIDEYELAREQGRPMLSSSQTFLLNESNG